MLRNSDPETGAMLSEYSTQLGTSEGTILEFTGAGGVTQDMIKQCWQLNFGPLGHASFVKQLLCTISLSL